MSTVCIQCAMEAMVRDEAYTPTNEEPEAHRARVHPDLFVTRMRRLQLEQILAARLAEGRPVAMVMNPRDEENDDEQERQ